MAFTEEHNVRIIGCSDLTVDGVIRTRGFKIDRPPVKLRVEQREPVALIVDRGGRSERVRIHDGGGSVPRLVWLAIPLVAIVVTRVSRSRRKRGT